MVAVVPELRRLVPAEMMRGRMMGEPPAPRRHRQSRCVEGAEILDRSRPLTPDQHRVPTGAEGTTHNLHYVKCSPSWAPLTISTSDAGAAR